MSSQAFSLQGKVALLTGATSGIGVGMCTGLIEAGVEQVILIHREDLESEGLKQTIQHYKDAGVKKMDFLKLDLAQTNNVEVEETVAKAIELSVTGQIDILINNAGIQFRSRFEEFPYEDFNRVLAINLMAPVYFTKAVGKHMLEKKVKGKIVFTASLNSFQGGFTVTPYAIAKAGINTFVKALSNEWACQGINVNAVAPGYIATNMTAALNDVNNPRYKEITCRIPIGRWGTPDDFKGPIVFLCSSASDYVSGETLVIDGGWMGR